MNSALSASRLSVGGTARSAASCASVQRNTVAQALAARITLRADARAGVVVPGCRSEDRWACGVWYAVLVRLIIIIVIPSPRPQPP